MGAQSMGSQAHIRLKLGGWIDAPIGHVAVPSGTWGGPSQTWGAPSHFDSMWAEDRDASLLADEVIAGKGEVQIHLRGFEFEVETVGGLRGRRGRGQFRRVSGEIRGGSQCYLRAS